MDTKVVVTIPAVTKESLELMYISHLDKLHIPLLGVTIHSTLWEEPTEPSHQVLELELDLEVWSLFGTLAPLPI